MTSVQAITWEMSTKNYSILQGNHYYLPKSRVRYDTPTIMTNADHERWRTFLQRACNEHSLNTLSFNGRQNPTWREELVQIRHRQLHFSHLCKKILKFWMSFSMRMLRVVAVLVGNTREGTSTSDFRHITFVGIIAKKSQLSCLVQLGDTRGGNQK